MSLTNEDKMAIVCTEGLFEESVIVGTIMAQGEGRAQCEPLDSRFFHDARNQWLWQTICNLDDEGVAPDGAAVWARLRVDGRHEDVGYDYAQWLVDLGWTSVGLAAHAETLRKILLKRETLTMAHRLANEAGRKDTDAHEFLDHAATEIAMMQMQRQSREGVTARELARDTMKALDARHKSKSTMLGVPTGLEELDAKLCGLRDKDLIILAARPSMGKTSLATRIVETAAIIGKTPTLVFSVEMSKEAIGERLFSQVGRVDGRRVQTAHLGEGDWARIARASNDIAQATFDLVDCSSLSISECRNIARRYHAKGRCKFIVIDYLQKMHADAENRQNEIAAISSGLKALAKELSVPVLALAQLNRGLESRADKRPMMSDLRESGQIEQDADVIMFLYRDEVYNEDTPDKGVAEIILGKQRNGELGTARVKWHPAFTRFDNV